MPRTAAELRRDALAIWRAGVDAVRAERLMAETVRIDRRTLHIGDEEINLAEVRSIAVVGAGKAGAGMATALEAALGPDVLRAKQVHGWVNIPDQQLPPTGAIHLHVARPAGVNEPTAAGVAGTERILDLVAALQSDDLGIVLLSGGGSALLPAPRDGVSLADKLAVTRALSAAGANIEQLNTVRRPLSRVKGGGLARACRAGRLFTLIISDVLGDPLDVIASGPTVPSGTTPADALAVLKQFALDRLPALQGIVKVLQSLPTTPPPPPACNVTNLVIGNNAIAVDAAGLEAERRGYRQAMVSAASSEGRAEDVGRHLADMILAMQISDGPNGLISGGEPVVELVAAERRGRGGRNQQLVLAALDRLLAARTAPAENPCQGLILLSGGTDGEDGPTDAAGAWLDADVAAAMFRQGLSPVPFLAANDAYSFFQATGGLLVTGPTQTNVCDLRVVLVDRP